MADWSALPPDLVCSVADRLLAAASDVDYYMDMRAVCHSWRLAMADPCSGATLLRFRPRHWIMLDDGQEKQGCVRLFLNISTGRFLRRRVPLLRDHVLVASSDGLLVLGDNKYPHGASVLNPLTGSLVRFAAAIPRANRVRAALAGSDGDPSLLFSFYHNPYSNALSCAHTNAGRLSLVQSPHPSKAGPFLCSKQAGMAAYRGHVYVADPDGQIVRVVATPGQQHNCRAELIATVVPPSENTGRRCGRAFLVASADDQLLVRLYHLRRRRAVEVFRVDVEQASLEPVRGIGRRALFLGGRCLLVEAGELPSVDGDCVYLVSETGNGVWRYDLRDSSSETRVSSFPAAGTFCLVQALLRDCVFLPDAKAQLHRVYRTRQSAMKLSWVSS